MSAVAAAPRAAAGPLTSRAARRLVRLLPLLAVLALLAVPPPGGAGDGSGTGTLADAASGALVLWAFGSALRAGSRPLTPFAAGLFALAGVGIAVAATGAGEVSDALPGMARYLQIFVLVPVSVLLLVRDRHDFRVVTGALVALALFEGGVGVHQYLTVTGASYMGEDIRAVGTFGASDIMGMATVVAYGVVGAVGLALAPGARTPEPGARVGRGVWAGGARRPLALACAAVLLLPLALSFSRGAWIATAFACGVLLLLSGVRRALLIVVAGAALAVVLVGGVGAGTALLQERLSSITQVTDAPDQSVTDRYTLWSAAVGMWRESPVTGVGLKGFPAHRDSHAPLALSSGSDTAGAGAAFHRQPLLSPHNMYLLVLSEQGLVGVCTLVAGWGALVVCGLRRLYGVGRAGGRDTDCALVAVGLLVWLLVDFFYGDIGGPSTVLTAVVLGLAAWWAVGLREVPDGGRGLGR